MKRILFWGLLMAGLSSWADAETAVSGKPRFIRAQPRTEVFFSDLKDSYWIAEDRRHNRFLKAFSDAAKAGKAVSFSVDPDTHQIIKVQGVKDPGFASIPGDTTDENSAGAKDANQ
jgi:hypothetical protein